MDDTELGEVGAHVQGKAVEGYPAFDRDTD
jgi:hypothetical protein